MEGNHSNNYSSRPDNLYTHPTHINASSASERSTPSQQANDLNFSDPPAQNENVLPAAPLEIQFDHQNYPAGAQRLHQYDNQSTTSQDSRNYGAHSLGRAGTTNFGESIPLRDHSALPSREGNITDHVYDASSQNYSHQAPNTIKKNSTWKMVNTGIKLPYVTYLLTLIQCAVFIVEIVKNLQLTGSPIEIHPSFNPMIGPSPYVLINMGARYVPCMHAVDGIQTRASGGEINWPCPNTTSSNIANCQLNNLCGFNMPASQNPVYPGQNISLSAFQNQPNQWFRFILPIFLHAGIVHIGFNMLLQMTLGKEMEIAIGSIRYFLVYMSAGIFGFVLGGNFAATGIASTGASGALFGVLALNLLDLLYTWGKRRTPLKDFAYIMLDIGISFVLGLLPGLDNFSHIGGFLMGLVLGICILHSPSALRERINRTSPPYTSVGGVKGDFMDRSSRDVTSFIKSPLNFFTQRRPAWWAWWLVRVGSLVFVFIVFILLLRNFYTFRRTCSWCKYLSCIDINNWCEIGNLQLTTLNTTS
ncbi:BgTH12-07051 [Blumeria graminis f. sp. triticale]|uniref:Rhomboid-type serine protease n=3 Tax=Blumeria graminis TaxID=34373 RepID=A0A061HL60_BLUGR|nr:hypothetical protein BGT96224_2695 [Blumeria graminis f. sp. tritici 96224]CAD6506121.1 BgTH12-07051 [Blumeria graminis f. sp. triticale]VDB94810.1 Bgt-2695 [Blumeria graminis f. sp. tritici]